MRIAAGCFLVLSGAAIAWADQEFDLSRHSVPIERIVSGGPPKDGIPALLEPRFTAVADRDDTIADHERVVGVARGTVAKAYPLAILNWHEVVNDTLGGEPIAVTYCPLTGSAVVFDRRIGGRAHTFGVSGRLYDSNVLMYDHQSDSLWSQLGGRALAGVQTDTAIESLPAVLTSWGEWRTQHPDTLVLSEPTAFGRDYKRNPYEAYEQSAALMFEPSRTDPRRSAKEMVLGVVVGQTARAYPFSELRAAGGSVGETVAGKSVHIKLGKVGAVATANEALLPAVSAYWFAWAAFHPDTSVWRQSEPEPAGVATSGNDEVRIEEMTSYWTSLSGAFVMQPESDPFRQGGLYVISGRLKNRSRGTLHHVRLSFELVDASGNVVLREEGFNRAAEGLLNAEDEPGRDPEVVPIPPDGVDTFRMIMIAEEMPPFDHPAVSVVSVHRAR